MLDSEMWWMMVMGLGLRLLLTPVAFHQDLLVQANWGQSIRFEGPKGFYERKVWLYSWPNHPPLTSLEYGMSHLIYEKLGYVVPRAGLYGYSHISKSIFKPGEVIANKYSTIVSPEIPFNWGYLICLKLLPIVGDVLTGVAIYLIAKKYANKPGWYLGWYLFLPIGWYISSLWGQTDPLAFLFTLISVIIIRKHPIASILCLWLSISLKPTALILGPVYLMAWYRLGLGYKKLIIGGLLALGLTAMVVRPFTSESPLQYFWQTIINKIFWRAEFRLTTNAYNFWHIFALNQNVSQEVMVGFLPAKWWGLAVFSGLNLIVFLKLRVMDLKQRLEAVFIVGSGGWFFLTNMLDRYLFTGLMSGLIVTMWRPKLFYIWLVMGLIFWLNLFRGWWYPQNLEWLKLLLSNNEYGAGREIAIGNTLLYGIFCYKILSDHQANKAKRA